MKRLIVVAFVVAATAAVQAQDARQRLLDLIDEVWPSRVVYVQKGGDLAAACRDAQANDVIEIEPAAVYDGTCRITAKDVEIRTRGVLPERRILATDAWQLATIRSGDKPPVQLADGSSEVRVVGVQVAVTRNVLSGIECGKADGHASIADIAHHVTLDRILIDIPDDVELRRGVALNCSDVSLTRSTIRGAKETSNDSQGVVAWDTPGRIRIEDNDIQGASEPLLIGGSDASIQGMTPTDIEILNNDISRPLAWRGKPWNIKNLLEIKHARRVKILGNRLSHNWHAAQTGYAVLFTPRNQGGGNPWAVVDDVLFEGNTIRDSASGIIIQGTDDEKPSGRLTNVVIRNNLVVLSRAEFGGEGRPWMLLAGPDGVTFDHNTFIHNGASIGNVDGPKAKGFVYTNNLHQHGLYGIIGSGTTPGNPTLQAFFENPIVMRNVFAGATGYSYPATNLLPSVATFARQFNADWSLTASSSWRNAGTDGRDLGATSLP